MIKRRTTFGLLAAAACAFALTTPSAAEDVPSGTVTIESTSVALGIGVTWGDGKLTYEGKTYNFTVNGLSVVDLGITSVTATGKVYHLKDLADFAGNYVAGQAGAAVGGGVAATRMKNQNGVVIDISSTQTGARLTLAAEGVQISLDN
ncbi:MAG: hypothetical protein Kilf2KO_48750 [Rhodospirillales bacterium]